MLSRRSNASLDDAVAGEGATQREKNQKKKDNSQLDDDTVANIRKILIKDFIWMVGTNDQTVFEQVVLPQLPDEDRKHIIKNKLHSLFFKICSDFCNGFRSSLLRDALDFCLEPTQLDKLVIESAEGQAYRAELIAKLCSHDEDIEDGDEIAVFADIEDFASTPLMCIGPNSIHRDDLFNARTVQRVCKTIFNSRGCQIDPEQVFASDGQLTSGWGQFFGQLTLSLISFALLYIHMHRKKDEDVVFQFKNLKALKVGQSFPVGTMMADIEPVLKERIVRAVESAKQTLPLKDVMHFRLSGSGSAFANTVYVPVSRENYAKGKRGVSMSDLSVQEREVKRQRYAK